MNWIINDTNETEYIIPDGADLTQITQDLENALSVIILGNCTGTLEYFPNIRKLYIAQNAKINNQESQDILNAEKNQYIEEIINNSEEDLNLNLTSEYTHLQYVQVKKWDDSIKNLPNLVTLISYDRNPQLHIIGFANKQYLKNLVLSSAIGENAFKGCTNLSNVILNDSVTSIGNNAFEGCSIKSIHIPCEIQALVFKDCKELANVSINSSIGANAFQGCSKLSNVILNSGVTSIGNNAFKDCDDFDIITYNSLDFSNAINDNSFVNIYFIGTEEEWHHNNNSLNADIWFYSETKPVDAGLYWYFDKSHKPKPWLNTMPLYRFKETENAYAVESIGTYNNKKLTIPSRYRGKEINSIDNNAFENCTFLETVIIPHTVTFIGANILRGCNNIKYLTIPFIGKDDNYIMNYSDSGYNNNYRLSYLFEQSNPSRSVPSSLHTLTCTGTKIPNRAFLGCENIINFNLNNVTDIGYAAFGGCSFESFTVPINTENIGSYAFYNCSNLSNFYINENIKKIYENAINITKIKNKTNENGYYIGTNDNPYLVFVLSNETYSPRKVYTVSSKTKTIVQNALQHMRSSSWLESALKFQISLPFIGPNAEGGYLSWVINNNTNISTIICNAQEETNIVKHAFYDTPQITTIKLLAQKPLITLKEASLHMNDEYETPYRSLYIEGVSKIEPGAENKSPIGHTFKEIVAHSLTQLSKIENSQYLIDEDNERVKVEFENEIGTEENTDTVYYIPNYIFQNYTGTVLNLSAYKYAEPGVTILRNSKSIVQLHIPRIPLFDGVRYLNWLWTTEQPVSDIFNKDVPSTLEELYICGTEYDDHPLWSTNSLRDSKIKHCVIDNSCTTIPSTVCRECTKLLSINIPKNLKSISTMCFFGCSKLQFKLKENDIIEDIFTDINDSFCYCNTGENGSYLYKKTESNIYILQESCGAKDGRTITLPINNENPNIQYHIDLWGLSSLRTSSGISIIIPNSYVNLGGQGVPRRGGSNRDRGIAEQAYIHTIYLGDKQNPINSQSLKYGTNMFYRTVRLQNIYVYYNDKELPDSPWGNASANTIQIKV